MLKYFKDAWVYLIIISLFNFLLLFLPMVNILSYESSVLNSIFLFFVVFYYFSSKNNHVPRSHNWLILLTFLLIPFLILFVNTIAFSNCGVCSGVQFYLLLVTPSALLGYSISQFFNKSHSLLFKTMIIFAFFLFFALESILELYLYPQMYFFNQIIGYFPGTVYDEYISISSQFIIYRILTNIFAFYLLFLCKKEISPKVRFTYIIAPLIIFFILKPYLGFATNINRTKNELEGKINSKHFTIYYDKSISERNIQFYSKLHEFYYNELSNTLNNRNKDRITSFIFKDFEQKSDLFGARNADVAKPWLNQIYLTENSIERNLKHELSHLLLGEYGTFPLKLPSGMDALVIEGFASAITNNFDEHSIHYPAKLAYDNGFKIEGMSLIHGIKFFTQTPSISYSYAGSLIKYLFDNFPTSAILKYYKTGNVVESLGLHDSTLSAGYFMYLDSLPKVGSKDIAQFYFGGSPIIARRCLRSAAESRKIAREKYRSKQFEESYKNYSSAYNENSEYANFYGIIASLNSLNRYKDALDFIQSNSFNFRNTRWEYSYKLLSAEEYYKNSKFIQANQLLDSIIVSNIHPYYVTSAKVLSRIIKDSINIDSADSSSLFNYYHSKVFSNRLEYFMPVLLKSAGLNDSLLKNIICNFANDISIFKIHEWNTILLISRFAEKLGLYEDASKIMNEVSRIGDDFYRQDVYKEELRKIKWLKKQKK